MARISAGVFTSHVPAIGAAVDLGKTHEPYWQPVFKGYEYSKQWLKDNQPDVILLVFNDSTALRIALPKLRQRLPDGTGYCTTLMAIGMTGQGQRKSDAGGWPHINVSGTVRP